METNLLTLHPSDLANLRRRAAQGDPDAIYQLEEMEVAAEVETFPSDLRALDHWVCRIGKVPVNPRTHENASCSDPETWAPFAVAFQTARHFPGRYDGLSFAFNGDGVTGIDLDRCRDPQTGVIEPWAAEIIGLFASYTEASPSGTGVHIFVRGKLPLGHACKKGPLEVYSTARFMTVTGDRITGYRPGNGIADCSEKLRTWHAKEFGDRPAATRTVGKDGATDGEITLNKDASPEPERLKRLFRDYPRCEKLFYHGNGDQSSAEFGLAKDAVRARWEGQQICDFLVAARRNVGEAPKALDYYRRTIAKARAAVEEEYHPTPAPRPAAASGEVPQEKKEASPLTRKEKLAVAIRAARARKVEAARNPDGSEPVENPDPPAPPDSTRCESATEDADEPGGDDSSGPLPDDAERTAGELENLKKQFRRHFHFSDNALVVDVVMGVLAGNHFDSDPVWLHLIGAPSSGKTETLLSTQQCDITYFLDDFTANTLVSGYRDPPQGKKRKKKKGVPEEPEHGGSSEPVKDYSLLPKLNGKVLITKDFTVIHSKPGDTRTAILSQLRSAYDGYYSRGVGNDVVKGFHSRFNYLTGMTPEIEKHWSLNTLGERFLMYRLQIDDRRAHTQQAVNNMLKDGGGTNAIRTELQDVVKAFIDRLKRFKPKVDEAMVQKVIDLAEVLATCRTYVHRERNDDIPYVPQAEMASRVAKQLLRIGQGVAIVRGHLTLAQDDFEMMKRIALDSIPTNRRLLLTELWERRGTPVSLETFAGLVSRISKKTVERELKNLAELGAVSRKKEPKEVGKVKTVEVQYLLSDTFREYCKNIGGIPR